MVGVLSGLAREPADPRGLRRGRTTARLRGGGSRSAPPTGRAAEGESAARERAGWNRGTRSRLDCALQVPSRSWGTSPAVASGAATVCGAAHAPGLADSRRVRVVASEFLPRGGSRRARTCSIPPVPSVWAPGGSVKNKGNHNQGAAGLRGRAGSPDEEGERHGKRQAN